jgi:hypothetical protein
VGVLVLSSVEKPQAQRVFQNNDPVQVLRAEAMERLSSAGAEPMALLGLQAAPPDDQALGRLAAAQGLSSVLLVELRRLDLSALEPLGQVEVDLRLRRVSREGRVLGEAIHSGRTRVKLTRAQVAWTVHMRQALARAMEEL